MSKENKVKIQDNVETSDPFWSISYFWRGTLRQGGSSFGVKGIANLPKSINTQEDLTNLERKVSDKIKDDSGTGGVVSIEHLSLVHIPPIHNAELVDRIQNIMPEITDRIDENPQLSPSEAIFGFVGWLTTRSVKLEIGASFKADPICNLIKEFLSENNMKDPRDGWEVNLKHPKEEEVIASKAKK